MMQKRENKIAIYSRKSKFTGKGESIGNQIELCKAYICTQYGETELQNIMIYEDEGFSGGDLNRPDFRKMMEDAKKGRLKAIVVYRLDRISRNISDFSGLIEELSDLHVDFISIKEQFDTSTPMGRAMMYIASVFSQLERETIAERIRDNMQELAKTGRWLGGTTPTGYCSESVEKMMIDGKIKKVCKLSLLPKEADVVRMIYDTYIEYDSQTITETELMRQGIKTRNNKYFTRFSIKSILQNPVYADADQDIYHYFRRKNANIYCDQKSFNGMYGVMAYNRTEQKAGKTTIFRPVDEWIIAIGQHQGVVSGKTWIKVQESLERNKSKSYRKPRKNEALLTGVLYCDCQSRMYPKLSQRKTADGKAVYTYVCKTKERSRGSFCNKKNINGNVLDEAVLEQIKQLSEDRVYFCSQLKQKHNFTEKIQMEDFKDLEGLYKKKNEMERKMEEVTESLILLEKSSAKHCLIERMEKLDEEIKQIDSRIHTIKCQKTQSVLDEIQLRTLCQNFAVFKKSVDEMTMEQKRMMIRTLIQKVVWDGTQVSIFFLGAEEGKKGMLLCEDSK